MGRRLYALRHPGAQHGLVHHAGIDALEPMVPPAQHLLEESDLRAGQREVGITVRPRPDQALARYGESLEQPRDCVLVGIGPAADGIDRALDRLVVLAYRAVLPVRIAPLVLKPQLEEQR